MSGCISFQKGFYAAYTVVLECKPHTVELCRRIELSHTFHADAGVTLQSPLLHQVAPICTSLREETAYLHPALCRTDLAISMHMLFTTGCSEHHEMAHRSDYQPGIHCTSINRNFGLYAAVMVTTCHVFWTTWSGALVPHSLMSIFNSRQHH